ncbi:MAG TPA: hypothetical protein GX717_02680 [Clostridiaceae bacterium]|nr:hypothetical protein [Clostridiaceae bacterium]
MKKTVKVEVCACTRCSMVGSMEIAQDILLLQSKLDEEGELKYDIELSHISRSDLNKEGYKSPIVFVNDEMFTAADSSTIMDAIVRASKAE